MELKIDRIYFFIYRLLKLVLFLSIATSSVERLFSTMNIIKICLCNRMRDESINDCLVTYIKRDAVDEIDNKIIME